MEIREIDNINKSINNIIVCIELEKIDEIFQEINLLLNVESAIITKKDLIILTASLLRSFTLKASFKISFVLNILEKLDTTEKRLLDNTEYLITYNILGFLTKRLSPNDLKVELEKIIYDDTLDKNTRYVAAIYLSNAICNDLNILDLNKTINIFMDLI